MKLRLVSNLAARCVARCAAALIVVSLVACGDRQPVTTGEAVFDFARDLDLAVSGFERSRLRAADPEFAARLGDGWADVETGRAGDTFRWMIGERAELDLFVSSPRDLELVCRCTALSWPGAPEQTLSVTVGTVRGASMSVPDGTTGSSEVATFLPAAVWRAGWNRLVLEASRATAPAEVIPGAADVRRLAVRVEALEFRGLFNAAAPTSNDGSLYLPVGTSVLSYLETPADLWWTPGKVHTEGAVRLGAYLHTAEGRSELAPGRIPVPAGVEMAVELVAEAAEPSWWQRLLGSDEAGAEVRIEGARLLKSHQRAEPSPSVGPEAVPNGTPLGVIVYMIDTLRADRLGAYGSQLGLTPNLDRLAEESVVFTQARAQSSWTRPSVASVFTGLYPQSHGVEDRNDALALGVDTLAEKLVAAGFDTGAVVTNGNVSQNFGMGHGFTWFHRLQEGGRESVHVLADELNQWGLYWLEQHQASQPDQPFFLYLHASDPHAPYTPAEPFAGRFASGADRALGTLEALRALPGGDLVKPEVRDQLIALYDAEVAWTDHQVGELVAALRERGLWRNTLLIVVSDHGEEFQDHGGWEHGKTLYDEQLRVPLLIKLPEGAGGARQVRGPAGHVDLLPTILDAAGVGFDRTALDGRSLWPALTGVADESTGATMLSHLELSDLSLRSLVTGRWKLIEDLHRVRRELFDLSRDPGELKGLSAEEPLRAGQLGQERRRLERSLEADAESSFEVELDEETRKQLEALGYAG